MNPNRIPTAIAALCATLSAQGTESEGPVMAIAHGFSIDASTVVPAANASTLLMSLTEFSDAAPDDWPGTAGLPNFAAILDGLPLDIDAFSIGYDYIQSTPTGIGLVPPGNWAGITFSVTRASIGAAGGVIAAESGTAAGAAGDVFFYVLPGSALPASLIDRTMRNQDSSEIDIDAPAAAADIDAHDIYVSLIFRENPQIVPLLPFVSVFFSVRKSDVPAVPVAWWSGTVPSGTTVFRRDWVAGAWTAPTPFLTSADLGITDIEDLDAVAVDLLRGRVLFSTSNPASNPGAPLRDPVLYHGLGGPGHFVYKVATGVPISDRIGLVRVGAIDDVDGICALDPGPGGQIQLDRLIGTPTQSLIPSLPSRLGTGVYRRRTVTNSIEIHSFMTGWPLAGAPSPGVAALLVAPLSPLAPLTLLSASPRPNPQSPYTAFAGHPEHAVLAMPSDPNLIGFEVFFQWVALDATRFDVGLPTGIKL
ncbi:MAG: hypothetical protein AB7T19_18735 [Planctomycetota bacterium]